MTRKVLVGMLLLGALFIFGLATFYVENWQFYLGKGYRLEAYFPVVHTLDEGDLVRMAGVAVGTVETLQIDTEAGDELPVRAVLWIQNDVRVRAEDTAVVRMAGLFGGNYVAIDRGAPSAPVLADRDRIRQTQVAPSITQAVEQAKTTLSEISTAFEDVSAITRNLREGKGALGRLVADEEMGARFGQILADVGEAADGLRVATDRMEKGEGVLGKLLMDDRMAADVGALIGDARELAENLYEFSEELARGEGTLGKLMSDDQLYRNLDEAVATVRDVAASFREGDGLLPGLLEDPKLADDVRALAENLRQISDRLATGQNTLGKLLEDDELYSKLNASLDDLNQFTAALAQGEGTIGKLVVSDETYNKLNQLVESLQGLLDAYREQSPVISFAGAVFGAF